MPEYMHETRDEFRTRDLSTRILHISDLHFGPHFLPHVADALTTQVEELRPQALVVSEDLTQRAKPGEFEAARIFIEALPVAQKLAVSGNHDIPLYRLWERVRAPRVLFQRNFEQPPLVRLINNNVEIVGLDSTETWRSFVNSVFRRAGEYSGLTVLHARRSIRVSSHKRDRIRGDGELLGHPPLDLVVVLAALKVICQHAA